LASSEVERKFDRFQCSEPEHVVVTRSRVDLTGQSRRVSRSVYEGVDGETCSDFRYLRLLPRLSRFDPNIV